LRPGAIRIRGTYADGREFHAVVEARPVDLPAIAQLWARARVSDLEDQLRLHSARHQAVKEEIVKLAIEHRLLTRFTAFVAIDEEVLSRGGELREVTQPVHMPAEWQMDLDQSMTLRLGAMPAMAGSTMAAMDGAVGMRFGRSPRSPEAMPPRVSRRLKGAVPSGSAPEDFHDLSPDDRRKVVEAARQLRQAIESARAALARGDVPRPSDIEAARATLLRLLTESGLGAVWIKLQRFLRSAALELVAALSSGAPAVSIAALFETHRSAFDEATEEAERNETGGMPGWRFWERKV